MTEQITQPNIDDIPDLDPTAPAVSIAGDDAPGISLMDVVIAIIALVDRRVERQGRSFRF